MCINAAEFQQRHQEEMRRNLRFNFFAHGVEGGLFMGAMAFVDLTMVMPKVIHFLKGPEWLIAATPMLMPIAFNGPAIFTSIWIERLAKMHPFILVTGFFQRIVYLIAGLVLIFQAKENPLVMKYFMHGTSHMLGLDVHDVGSMYHKMQAGMVWTIEPGIYIREEGLGVRIENNVLITKTGVDDLMKNIPIEVEEIEDLMNEK